MGASYDGIRDLLRGKRLDNRGRGACGSGTGKTDQLRAYLKRLPDFDDVEAEERAMNHAFPVLTLNVHFLGSDDELLSSFLHEQLHWYLAQHRFAMEDTVRQLKAMYPRAPVGLPEGADTEYSTYGHLIDCYLEIQADRELIGRERTDRVIKNKPWYTWIYKTILQDEDRIAALVKAEQLEMN